MIRSAMLRSTARTFSKDVLRPSVNGQQYRVTRTFLPTLRLATAYTTTTSKRLATASTGPISRIDSKHEKEVGAQRISPHPDQVSADSSVHPIFGEVGGAAEPEHDTDMMAGVRSDMVCDLRQHSI